ncbi:hypothetical protein [Aquipuribacter sp. SD81]|uniref:hypothetical protein n=1 Tax=Aquipuribacter sp. SD81 TaxID=3127703 RepID=UPI0030198555
MGWVLLAVVVTLLAFGAGLLVGWLYWGRRFFVGRLTRQDAESLALVRLEQERGPRPDGRSGR